MAVAAKAKFCFPIPTVFQLSTAILIMWSVSAAAGEPRRCYWCGPLAEQVHRSRRAPSCDAVAAGGGHVTACEPGLTHCAVVAMSPPHTESRFCVKMYQDECYPLFCNSTKTWKMTCPCRGDLCNGNNTDRETEAFGILAKLVTKTHRSRIVRSALNDDDTTNESSQNTVKNNDQIITSANENEYHTAGENANETATGEMQNNTLNSDSTSKSNDDQKQKSVTDDNNDITTTQTVNESSQSSSDNINDMKTDEPSNEPLGSNVKADEPSNEPVENAKSENIISYDINPTQPEITVQIDKNNDDNKITAPATIIDITLQPMSKYIGTTESPIKSEVETKQLANNVDDIPTVKTVLQENGDHVEGTTINYKYITTASIKPQKSNVVRISLDIFIAMNWIVISYLI